MDLEPKGSSGEIRGKVCVSPSSCFHIVCGHTRICSGKLPALEKFLCSAVSNRFTKRARTHKELCGILPDEPSVAKPGLPGRACGPQAVKPLCVFSLYVFFFPNTVRAHVVNTMLNTVRDEAVALTAPTPRSFIII